MDSPWKTLLRFTKGVRPYFFLAVATTLIFIFFNFMSPQIIRVTVDSVIGHEPFAMPGVPASFFENLGGRDFFRQNLIWCAVAVALCALGSGIFTFISRSLNAHFTETFVRGIRDKLYSHVQRLPFRWHVENQTGDIIQRCTSDLDVIRNFAAGQLLQAIRTVFIIIVALSFMFSMHVKLSLVALVFTPLVAGYSYFFRRRIASKFRQADEAEGALMVAVQENLTGVRVVRAFGRERHELERFDARNNHFVQLWVKMGYTMGAFWGIGDLVTGAQVLVVILFGAVFAARGELTIGQYLTFVTYNNMLGWPVRALGRVLSEMSKAQVSAERIRTVLAAGAEEEQPEAQKPDLRGDIVFENVTFGYGGEPVLKNISFRIPFGTTFGVLGGTGSGKSTLTYLLNRLYDLPEGAGRITIGGVDIRQIDRAHLRRSVGLVLQEPFLFSKTLYENIAVTQPGAPLERVREKAAVAAVDASIMSFGKGYETLVGERGVTLSGGQKQRVAIARTLMTDAPIMIFDDSLSAVDLETDAQIRQALRRDTQARTVMLIAHRLSTLQHADQVLVLEGGGVAQLGSPQALLQQEGPYRRLYRLQSQSAQV